MIQLSTDESFHFELLRCLAVTRYCGSDVGEVLEAASKIQPGDFESLSSVFNALATRVFAQAGAIDSTENPVSARDAYFRAATYFRLADFYLHGNPDDPRINELWKKQTFSFDKAISLLPIPGKRVILKAEGFSVPIIFYAAAGSGRKPTYILGHGYDGAQEEMLHNCGFAALERGWNVITYEGPGQPSVRRYQGLGYIVEWEKVVTPVVDYLARREDVDMSALGLIGFSMGGWMCCRAAAFEHRLAAVMSLDGVYDVGKPYLSIMGPGMGELIENDPLKADEIFQGMLAGGNISTTVRWGIEHGLWSFNTKSTAEFLDRASKMTLKGLEEEIQCPVFIGCAEDDQFFKGQPEELKEALGEKGTLVKFGKEDAAGNHCQLGALVLLNQVVGDWFHEVIDKRKEARA